MMVDENKKEENLSPDMCVKAGKCLMKEMMNKMSREDYLKLSDEDKDREDEKEVMKKEE